MPSDIVQCGYTKHLRFTSFLSGATLQLLKEQVYRVLQDQEKDALFEQFMDLQPKENEIMLYAEYCDHVFDLPTTFNSIIKADFSDARMEVNSIIPFSVINGWAAINKIEVGHKHACLVQFDNEVPDIVKNLPEVNSRLSSTRYELCFFNWVDVDSKSVD